MLPIHPLTGGRTYAYTPAPRPPVDSAPPWDGILAIRRWIGGPTPRSEADRFGVAELPPRDTPGLRVFQVGRESLAGDRGPTAGSTFADHRGLHRVSLAPGVQHCTCPDFAAGRICGHLLALTDLLGHGAFPDPLGDDPREAGDPGELLDAQASDPASDPSSGRAATGDLGGGLSYRFTPARDPGSSWDGLLILTRTLSDAGPTVVQYRIAEQSPETFPGRVFRIAPVACPRDSDPAPDLDSVATPGPVFRCSIGSHVRHCTCPAAAAGLVCEHVLALTACVEHGAFPDPLGPGFPEPEPAGDRRSGHDR